MARRDMAIWTLFTAALLLLLAEIPLVRQSDPTRTTHVIEIVLVVGALALAGGSLFHQRASKRDELALKKLEQDRAPQVVVGDPVIKQWTLSPRHDAVQGFTTGDTFTTVVSGTETPGTVYADRERIHAAHLHVSNEPINRASNEIARAVNLSIRYLRDGEIIPPLKGRWSTDSQNLPFEATQMASEHDLAPHNANPDCCDVAIKYPDDDECYGMDDTVKFHPNDWRKYPLGTAPLDVEVTANRSGGASVVTRWRLTHDGPGGALHLDPAP